MGVMDLPVARDPAEEPPDTPLPVVVRRPAVQTAPVIFASPHSGRLYPPDFVAAARLDPISLRRSEDSFVDELFAAAPDAGAPLISATFPRAYCDPNREPWELDPAMFDDKLPDWVNTSSARVSAGLGTIARVVASGEGIYRTKLRFAEAERRVRLCWEPFHAELQTLIAATRARFGLCVLVDCHSMPGGGPGGGPGSGQTAPHAANGVGLPPRPDFVIGDAHGTTCAPRITRLIETTLAGFGFDVRRNDPYAGGYITRTYGRPREGVHAVQIEIGRQLYMDEARIERAPRFAVIQAEMTRLIAHLVAESHLLAA